jgi:hypothetical protein
MTKEQWPALYATPDEENDQVAEVAEVAAPEPDEHTVRNEIQVLQASLHGLRGAVTIAQRAVALARASADKARLAWLNGGQAAPTPAQLVRDHIAAELADRIARGGQRGPSSRGTPGPSALDRAAFYGSGRFGTPAGGGNAFRRGQSSRQGQINLNPKLGPTWKPPAPLPAHAVPPKPDGTR